MQFIKGFFSPTLNNLPSNEDLIPGFIGLYTLDKLPNAIFSVADYLIGNKDEYIKTLIQRNNLLFRSGPFKVLSTVGEVISRLDGSTRFPRQAYIIRLRFDLEKTTQLASQGRFHEAILDAYEYQTIRKLTLDGELNFDDLTLKNHSIRKYAVMTFECEETSEEGIYKQYT